ncbi:MAG: ABC transporter ATP-binding protein [Anaerolineales bacterium]|jgi:branched-chain amino acid transport system ATP-binding protein
MLELQEISVYYGNIRALDRVSMQVRDGELVTLIGSNGAGKSTTLKTISGLLRPKSGSLHYNGHELERLPPYRIVALGISQAPEGRRIFKGLTVAENLRMGAVQRTDTAAIRADTERVYSLFPILKERSRQVAGTLSGGEQQMLAIARALMSRPKLLLLDEPSLGLAPLVVKAIFETITRLKEEGTTILLVEQNARLALDVADRAYVMESGRIILEGLTEELKRNPQIENTYLGT